MIKIEKINIALILLVVLALGFLFQGYQIDQLKKADSSVQEQFEITISQIDWNREQNIGTDTRLENLKEDVAILWYKSIPRENFQKIIHWYNNNTKFQEECGASVKDFSISSGFMGYEGELADTLRIELVDIGYQVIREDGTVDCYAYPILNMTPTPVECSEICEG